MAGFQCTSRYSVYLVASGDVLSSLKPQNPITSTESFLELDDITSEGYVFHKSATSRIMLHDRNFLLLHDLHHDMGLLGFPSTTPRVFHT